LITFKTSGHESSTPGGVFDLDTVVIELKTLESEMEQADFWSDSEHAQSVSKQAAELRQELDTWRDLLAHIDDTLELGQLAQEQGDESVHDEIADTLTKLESRFSKLEFATLFSGDYDKNNAIVSIHAGSGGTEAQDWTQMLLRMFTRFAESRDWKVTVLSESRADDVGIKSVTIKIGGRYAYGYLQSEAGVHRLVRISPFDAEKMRHTTFALVDVLPELDDDIEIELDPKDLRIDTFMAGGHGGQSVNTTYSAVRVVHLPTNLSVSCQNERSQLQNKETALKILKSKLHKIELERQKEEKKKLRGDYQSAEWGNQIRSYVLHPYKMVKDHRTQYETSDTVAVLDGDLEPFMEAYLQKQLDDSDRFEQVNHDSY
jgi:peptide chain release factor 2